MNVKPQDKINIMLHLDMMDKDEKRRMTDEVERKMKKDIGKI